MKTLAGYLPFVISFSTRSLSAFCVFLSSIAVTRVMDPEQSGYYFLAFGLISILSIFSRIGLDNVVVKHVGAGSAEAQWGEVRDTWRKSFAVIGLVSSLAAITLYAGSDLLAIRVFNMPDLAPVLRAISPGIIGLALTHLFARCLQGIRKIVFSLLIMNILTHLCFALAMLLFDWPAAASNALLFSLASLSVMLAGIAIWRSALPFRQGAGQVKWQELYHTAAPLWLVAMLGLLTPWSGQFITGAMLSSELVALLAVAQRIASVMGFILGVVNYVLMPRFAVLHRGNNPAEPGRLLVEAVNHLLILVLPLFLLMQFFPHLLLALFGDFYQDAANLLRILAIGQFINVITGPCNTFLIMSGHEREVRNAMLVAAPLALVLALLLVPQWGVVGGAVSISCAVGFNNLLLCWRVKVVAGINVFSGIPRVLASARTLLSPGK